ncbi:MAG TPA: OmpA family protein [Thermodesulfovibrionales bacterium]|nr:OmpA family protein [Thermodesulfovibrionales bacterium]
MQVKKSYFTILVSLITLVLFAGCAGMEFAPKRGVWFYPKDIVAADKAVTAAKKAGKDKQCPVEFADAKAAKKNAYDTYLSCKTKEGISLAKEAAKKAEALCPKHPKVLAKFVLTVNFDFDKSKLRKADKEQLKKAIEFIKKYPDKKIKLEGYTDSKGSKAYNLRLSQRRASATKEYLVKTGGIDPTSISTKGLGESDPVASNKTKAGRAKNRRVEILILE